MAATAEPRRCDWAGTDPLYVDYHDREWGVPVHDDRTLFELITLEGAQAGLSWITVLRKREAYRKAFHGFDVARVARDGAKALTQRMANAGLVRHRGKLESAVTNAQAFLKIQEEKGSFAAYQWAFVDGKPVRSRWKSLREVPTATPVSDALSKDLKGRGFKFVGSTIVYAYMQAVGMVNDHLVPCFRHSSRVP